MKAQTKAILASLVVIAVALSAVSGVTYSWWSDSENTDIDVSTGALDVKVLGDIRYSSEEGTSGFFTVNKADPVKSGTTTSLNLITNLSNVAPNDVYYIDYLVQYETTVFAQYLTFVGDDSPWIDVKVESYNQSTLVDGVITSTENGFTLMKWKNIPDKDTLEPGSLYVANEYVRVTITIDDDAPMNADSTVQIINEITQKANNGIWDGTVPGSLDETTLDIVPGGGTQTGTITINSVSDFVYLNKLAEEWVSIYSNGQGTNVGSYNTNVGGKGTDYYYHWTWDIVLATDLDMNDIPMDSVDITYWDSFDGKGHTISNVVLNPGENGLFNIENKAIYNLTVRNIEVSAPDGSCVGAVATRASMEGVHVENATVIGGKYVGGLVGKGSSFINCSVKDSTVIGSNDQKTVGGLVGYSIGDPGAATVTGNLVENVTVIGAYNVGGLLGQAQNETVEDNTVKNVTVKSTRELPGDASSNEVRAAKLAARSAFADTIIGSNTIENVTIVKSTTVASTADLQDAIDDGLVDEIVLEEGEYEAYLYYGNMNRNLTIIGQGVGTKLSFSDQQVNLALFDSLTISNCTIEHMATKSWGHLVFGSSASAGGVYTISDCTFIGENTQGIYINQTVPATFNIEGCTFTGSFGGEGAITIQNNSGVGINVNVIGCTFDNVPSGHQIYVFYNNDDCSLNVDEGVDIFQANKTEN